MDSLQATISYFEQHKDTRRPTDGSFYKIVTSAKLANKYGPLLERIRTTADKKQRDALKVDLPCFTPSGTFSHRAAAGLIAYSGLMQFDIDPKGNPYLDPATAPELKKQIANLDQVAYCALSASGMGVWGVVPIAYPERYKEHFNALKSDFAAWGIVIDPACGNIDRLRFWSYDPDAYFNHSATIYKHLEQERADTYAPQYRQYTQTDNSAKVEAIIKQIEATRTDITDGYATNWLPICSGIANEFGESGRDYFHRISQYHPEYQTAYTDKQFTKCLHWKTKHHSLGALFAIAKEYGFEFKEHLHSVQRAAQVAPAPPQRPHRPPEAQQAGHRIERHTEQATGRQVEIELNEHGYPAAWDITPAQSESLTRVIQNNPSVTDLIQRFDLKLDGITALTDG